MITLESTTDSPEQVAAAIGDQKVVPVENKSAVDDKSAKTVEASEASKKVTASAKADETKAVEAKGEDSESSEDADESAEESASKKGNVQKRFDKITKQRRAAEQEVERLRAELAKRDQQNLEAKPDGKPEAVKADGEPVEDDFKDLRDYYKALAAWTFKQEKAQDAKVAQEMKEKEQFQMVRQKYAERVDEFKEAHSDWDKLMDSVEDIKLPAMTQQAIVESEVGAELAYELAKDRELLEKISEMPYHNAIKALGKLEAKIEEKKSASSQEVKQTKTTKAPLPLKTVGARSTGSGRKTPYDAATMTQREYEQSREAQE